MQTLIDSASLAALTRQLFRLPYACGVRSWILRLQRKDLERCQMTGRTEVQIQLPGGHQRMIVDRADRIGSLFFWLGRHHRQQIRLAARLLPSDGVFLDVGANIGEFSIAMAIDKPHARVLAVEPNAVIRLNLLRNIEVNLIQNIECLGLALGDEAGKQRLYQCNDSSLTSFVPVTSAHTAADEVDVCTLDELMELQSLSRLDLLKVDVEGYELKVLSGGRQTLERLRPSLILEVNSETSQAAGFDVADLYDLLRTHRYRFYAWRARAWREVIDNFPTQEDIWAEPVERASPSRRPTA